MIVFDKKGKGLLLEHLSAGIYYQANFFIGGGISIYYYLTKDSSKFPFLNITYSMVGGIFFFGGLVLGNRHIKKLHLLNCGKQIEIDFHTFFSLWKSTKTY